MPFCVSNFRAPRSKRCFNITAKSGLQNYDNALVLKLTYSYFQYVSNCFTIPFSLNQCYVQC